MKASSSAGIGVGDSKYSWGYDGDRVKLWHDDGSLPALSYGATWRSGDIVGVLMDLDAKTIAFSLNGSFDLPMGVACRGLHISGGLVPALSLTQGYGAATRPKLRLNFGAIPFRFPLPSPVEGAPCRPVFEYVHTHNQRRDRLGVAQLDH